MRGPMPGGLRYWTTRAFVHWSSVTTIITVSSASASKIRARLRVTISLFLPSPDNQRVRVLYPIHCRLKRWGMATGYLPDKALPCSGSSARAVPHIPHRVLPTELLPDVFRGWAGRNSHISHRYPRRYASVRPILE